MPFLSKHPVLFAFAEGGWLAVIYTAKALLVFMVMKSSLAKSEQNLMI